MNRATEEHSKIVGPVIGKNNTIVVMNCSHASGCENLDESLRNDRLLRTWVSVNGMK